MAKTSELFDHVQRFVREVFSHRLREAGFSSYKGEDVHWFRLVNGEVIQSVYFVTRHNKLPAFLEIQYGCHPTFIPPILQRSPYVYALPGYEQMYDIIPQLRPGCGYDGRMKTMIRGAENAPYRAPDVMVMCLKVPPHGLDILEQVLSVLDGLDTPLACYEAHKCWRAKEIENGAMLTMSTYFVDEVLFWQDQALYPYCKVYISAMRNILEKMEVEQGKLSRKADREELDRLRFLQQILDTGDRQTHLSTLEQAARTNLHQLATYTGIQTMG